MVPGVMGAAAIAAHSARVRVSSRMARSTQRSGRGGRGLRGTGAPGRRGVGVGDRGPGGRGGFGGAGDMRGSEDTRRPALAKTAPWRGFVGVLRFLRMLVDVHAHFYHARTPRADWRERNASRIRAGDRIGITTHVASILGTWGHTSPTYFPSPADVVVGNDALLALAHEHATKVR